MIHHFDCDNCGKKVETHCFDDSDLIVTYYTPALEFREPIETLEEFEEYLMETFGREMTTLCRECITQ